MKPLETLIRRIPPFKNLFANGDILIDLLRQSNSKQLQYKEALEALGREQTLLHKVLEEIFIHGETDHLKRARAIVEVDQHKQEKKCNKIKGSLDELNLKLSAAQVIYDKGSDKFGMFWASCTMVFIVLFVFYVRQALLGLAMLNPSLKNSLDMFALNINPTFYELVAQIILALTVALFIKKSHYKTSAKVDWLEYSKFAMGVTCALAGTTICLFVVAGATSGVYKLSLVIFCLLVLLYSALKPLLYKSSEA